MEVSITLPALLVATLTLGAPLLVVVVIWHYYFKYLERKLDKLHRRFRDEMDTHD